MHKAITSVQAALVIIVVVVAVAATAYVATRPSTPGAITTALGGTTTAPAATTTSALAPIKIGTVLGLSGQSSPTDTVDLQIVKMWVNEVNSQGGLLGHQVVLVSYDDQSNPELAAQYWTKLFTVDKVDLCIAGLGSPFVAPLVELAKQYNYVCPAGGTLPTFYQPGNRWMIGYLGGFAQNYSLPYFQHLVSIPQSDRPQTLALVYPSDNQFSVGCAQGVRAYAARYGFRLTVDQGYPSSTTDFSAMASLLKSSSVDALVACTYRLDSYSLTKSMAQFKFNPRSMFMTIGPQYFDFPNKTGGLQDRIMSTAFWGADLPNPTSQAFLRTFQQAIGGTPDWSTACVYAGLQILQQSVVAVNSFDQTAIGKYILTHSFSTVLGNLNYNNGGNGEPDPNLYLQQWQGTKLVTVTDPKSPQVLYPKLPFP